jgi:hypothetical protein
MVNAMVFYLLVVFYLRTLKLWISTSKSLPEEMALRILIMMLEIHYFHNIFLPPTESNPDEVGDKIGLFFKTLKTSAPSIRDADKFDYAFATGMFLFQPFFDLELGGGITISFSR